MMLEEKKELLELILSKNRLMDKNFVSIDAIEVQPASADNQHFGSLMERLIITFSTDKGKSATASFIMKSKAPPGGDTDIAEMIRAFPVELEIYQTVLKNMNVILEKEDVDEIPWPKYFGCENYNMLLEDLKTPGYRMVEKQGMMDIDHAKLAVEGLAKFHALSMIVIERGLFDKDFLSPSVYAQNIPFMIDMHNSAFNGLVLSMERSWGEQWQTAAKRVRQAAKNVGDKLKKLWNDTKGQYNVINHGDCWTNNMLFKYSDVTGKPMNIKLVDFQLCHYNSPCWDLVHFLYTALLPETRERHMTSLLTTYADSLGQMCQRFGYRNNIPRITYLQETIQKLSYYAFVLSCSSLPILIVSSNELNPEGETLEHEDNTGIHYPLYKFDMVKQTMKSELKWFLETCKQVI